MKLTKQPDIDICSECKDHASFYCCEAAEQGQECDSECEGQVLSNCCGASSYDTDYDFEFYD